MQGGASGASVAHRASKAPIPAGTSPHARNATWLCGSLAVRELPVGPHEVARVAVRIALQVILVLGLGLPERYGLAHLGHDLPRPQAGGVDVGDRLLRHPALFVRRVEDLRAVAAADVVPLPVLGRR